MGDPLDALIDAFDAALNADPDFVIATIEATGRHAPEPIRSTLFRVFSHCIRGNRRNQVAVDAAIDLAFRRMGGDWGEQIVHDAADFIEDAARYVPELVSGRVDELFGLLLSYVSAPTKRASILDVSPDTPPVFRALEASQHGFMRTATIRKLREALGHLVQSAPEAVARNVFSVIGATEIETPEAEELRDEAVRLLGDLGKRPDLLPDVLPALWTALLHRDQSVRAQAIEAWREIASVAHRELPSDIGELLPRLLADQYVIVHKGVVRALARGLPVPEPQRSEVVRILLALADYYKTDDADLLEDILVVLWSQARHYAEPSTRALRETCLVYSKHLSVYDKARFLQWRHESGAGLPSYAERLVETLADPERNRVGGHRDDRLFRVLRDLRADQVEAVAGLLPGAARQHLPDDTWEAQRFIEILQRCGYWTTAAELAAELVDVLPDDAEHAIQRDGLVRQRAVCDALCSLIDGAADTAAQALSEAREANSRQTAGLTEQRYPWAGEE